MKQERVTAEQFRAGIAADAKPATHTSGRGADVPNPYRGLSCWICDKPVLQRHPADSSTEILPGGQTGRVRVRHLRAEDCKP